MGLILARTAGGFMEFLVELILALFGSAADKFCRSFRLKWVRVLICVLICAAVIGLMIAAELLTRDLRAGGITTGG